VVGGEQAILEARGRKDVRARKAIEKKWEGGGQNREGKKKNPPKNEKKVYDERGERGKKGRRETGRLHAPYIIHTALALAYP
jgi:hypothetical protein